MYSEHDEDILADVVNASDNLRSLSELEASFSSAADLESELTIKDCLKAPQFYLLCLMMYCSIFYGYFIANIYKDYGETTIKDDKFLSFVGAMSAA